MIEIARDAVRELLDESRHDAWMGLRGGYGEMCAALERDESLRDQEEREGERSAERQEERQKRQVWDRATRQQREAWLFQALGDERLTTRELAHRLYDRFCVYDEITGRLVRRLYRAGQLERQHPRPHRYFRKRVLAGPIAQLERAYQDSAEGGDA